MATVRAVSHIMRCKKFRSPGIPISTTPFYSNTISIFRYSTQKSVSKVEDTGKTGSQVQTSFAEVVKENTKSAWYMSVIIAGVGVTAVIFYAVFKELFSSKSPNSVYTKAVERCMKDPRVLDALGEPIKAFGEENRRGRRRHVSHTLYTRNEKIHMRMKFYIQGLRKRGTVQLEVKENDSGNFEYRYLFIEVEDMMRSVIILEDNRAKELQIQKTEDISQFPIPA